MSSPLVLDLITRLLPMERISPSGKSNPLITADPFSSPRLSHHAFLPTDCCVSNGVETFQSEFRSDLNQNLDQKGSDTLCLRFTPRPGFNVNMPNCHRKPTKPFDGLYGILINRAASVHYHAMPGFMNCAPDYGVLPGIIATMGPFSCVLSAGMTFS